MTRTTLVLLLCVACGDDSHAPGDGAPGRSRAVIVAGSFMAGETGVMSELTFDPPAVLQRVAPNGAVSADPLLRKVGGELFVVNRDSNNITILDAATYAVSGQLATGAGSNPQDVAVWGDKLFVATFRMAGVLVLPHGGGAPQAIDLSAFDPDGEPNCVSAYTVGDEVYVACGLLDEDYKPRGPGRIAVIDAATNAVKTSFSMASRNPFGVFEQLPADVLGGDLVIPTVPSFTDFSTGCVERIETGAAPKSNGCVVTNSAVGGYVGRLAFQRRAGASLQWMIVNKSDPMPRGNLQTFDLGTQALLPGPVSPATQVLVDVAVCPSGLIVVADRTMAANGLRVYDGSVEQTASPLPVGLQPASAHGLACYE
jgi:YVTN family beta-propeller protein